MYFFSDVNTEANFAKRGPMSDEEYLRRYGRTRKEAATAKANKPKKTPATKKPVDTNTPRKTTPQTKRVVSNAADNPGFIKRTLTRAKKAPLKYKLATAAVGLGASAVVVNRYRPKKDQTTEKTALDRDLKRLRSGTEAVRNVGSAVRAGTSVSDTMRSWTRLRAQLAGNI